MSSNEISKLERAIKFLESRGIKVEPVNLQEKFRQEITVSQKDHTAFEKWARKCYPDGKFYMFWTRRGKIRFKDIKTLEILKRNAGVMREAKRQRHLNGVI